MLHAVRRQTQLQRPVDARGWSERWCVRCSPAPLEGGGSLSTVLRYEVAVVPHLSIPGAVVAHVVRCGLPANLTAVARRAEEVPPPAPPTHAHLPSHII